MSSMSYSIERLRELARAYEAVQPLAWQEVQGIHKFLEHLKALPAAEPSVTPCPLCGMTRAAQQPCPYCGC